LFSGLSMLQDDLVQLRRTVQSAVYHIALLVIPGTIFLLCFTREITLLFLGEKYEDAVPIVQILFIGVVFRSLIKIGDAVVRAMRAKFLYMASMIKAFFFLLVAAAAYFGYKTGLQGVAWGLVIAVCIQFLLITGLSCRIISMSPLRWIKKSIPGVIAGLITLAACLFTRWMLPDDWNQLLARGIIGAVATLIALVGVSFVAPWVFKQGKDNLLGTIADKVPVSFLKNRWKK
ncbi:MAG: oligosaccharide flippase family protein, partial [Flavobacteriales bacterium]|nr:oligosaccharide flippase family protein [Flavobacteriales bacterium]